MNFLPSRQIGKGLTLLRSGFFLLLRQGYLIFDLSLGPMRLKSQKSYPLPSFRQSNLSRSASFLLLDKSSRQGNGYSKHGLSSMSGNDRTTPYEERVETWKGEGSSSTLSFSLLVPSRFFLFQLEFRYPHYGRVTTSCKKFRKNASLSYQLLYFPQLADNLLFYDCLPLLLSLSLLLSSFSSRYKIPYSLALGSVSGLNRGIKPKG